MSRLYKACMRYNKSLNRVLFLLVGLSLLFQSCSRDEPTTWNMDIAGPIAQGRLSLNDMVADSLLSADENGLWHLVISENLTDFDLDSIVAIPDTTIKQTMVVPLVGGPFSIPPNSSIISLQEENQLNVSQASLKEVHTKGGTLQYVVKNYIDGYLTCTYELPGVTKNGTVATLVAHTQPGTSSNPHISYGSLDLAGYELDMTGESGNSTNTLFSNIIVKTSIDAPGDAQVFGQDSVAIELTIVDPEVSYARGYFGQHEYELNQDVDFGETFDLPQGVLNLNEVSVNFEVENFVGADAQIEFHNLVANNSVSATSTSLESPDLFSVLNVTRATDVNGLVTPTYNEISISESNSNIDVFLETLPDQVSIDATISINPLGNISDNNDFIYTDETLNAWLNMDIPLCIGMQGLSLHREIELTGETSDIVANGVIYLHMINAFPFEAKVSLVLRSAESEEISVLLEEAILSPGLVNSSDGIDPQESLFTILLPQDVIDQLIGPNQIFLDVQFDTPADQEFAKLKTDNYIDFVLSTSVSTQISIR